MKNYLGIITLSLFFLIGIQAVYAEFYSARSSENINAQFILTGSGYNAGPSVSSTGPTTATTTPPRVIKRDRGVTVKSLKKDLLGDFNKWLSTPTSWERKKEIKREMRDEGRRALQDLDAVLEWPHHKEGHDVSHHCYKTAKGIRVCHPRSECIAGKCK